ncbi:MAG TPA: hypothetical protein VIM22_05150, partial [Solirubrobacteraceae bacterium]
TMGRVSLKLVSGPANSAKARVVLDGVRAALDRDPLLVVPTAEDVDRYRRELAEDGLVFGARVVRFDGLLREVARRAGVTGRPLGDLARERVIAAAIRRAGLRVLAPSAVTPGFAAAAARFLAELTVARVDPARLTSALRTWAGDAEDRRAYAEELAAINRHYVAELERLGRRDTDGWALAALDALRLAPDAWGGTPVFFYGFDDLTPLQRDAVETLALRVDAEVWVSLTYEPGRAAFAGRATTMVELEPLATDHVTLDAAADFYAPASRAALHALERGLFEPAPERGADPTEAVALLESAGERAEAELVAAEVRHLLATGVPPDEIAVVARSVDDVARVLEPALAEAGVPIALRRLVPFGHTGVGAGLLALLRCGALDGTAGDALRWLRAPGVLRVLELADVVEARARQDTRLTAAEALEGWPADTPPPGGLERVRRAARSGPAALCEALSGELDRMVAGLREAHGPTLLDAAARTEARAASSARRSLDELAELAAIAPRLAPSPAELAATLAALDVVVGESPGPGRVTVTDPLALRARRVRTLVLCGLQEGAFPRPARPEAFLSDAQRRELAEASGLVLPRHEDTLEVERYLFYAAASRPEERLVLSFRTAEDDGDPAVPSLFVDDVRDLFTPALWER